MALVVISIDRGELPKHTDKEFKEWVRFKVGDIGAIEVSNPLCELDMEATVRECSQ